VGKVVINDVVKFTREFRVVIGCGALNDLPKILEWLRPHKALVITDSKLSNSVLPKVKELISEVGLESLVITLGGGEGVKSLSTLVKLWELMIESGLTRGSVVIALGGGTVLDVAGFAASTFMRGCKLVNIPTTLLSQVDACLGGKTGIDLIGKNTVGTYYQAHAVVIDPELLRTLPNDVFREGISEVVKYAVIDGEPFLKYLEGVMSDFLRRDAGVLEDVIRECIEVKLSIIRRDYVESGVRAVLNFGHTVGHALERLSEWSLSHGKAVSIGLVIESLVAHKLLNFPLSDTYRIRELLSRAGLPTVTNASPSSIIEATKLDKKFVRGLPKLPLPRRLGEFEIVEVDWGVFRRCLEVALRMSVAS